MNTETPDPSWSIRRFAVWWLRHPRIMPTLDPLRLIQGGKILGFSIYRAAPFQVQLFTLNPNVDAPHHSHPNIDSIEYHLSGQSDFRMDQHVKTLAGMFHVPPGEFHTASAGPGGAAFLSLQKWINAVPPSSVELDWGGAPMDAAHAVQIEKPWYVLTDNGPEIVYSGAVDNAPWRDGIGGTDG